MKDFTINFDELFAEFRPDEKVLSAEPYGEGHINRTYLVCTDDGKYILQQINNDVFPNVKELMENILNVTEFLKSRNAETLNVIKTVRGEAFFEQDGAYFRVYDFIENTVTYQSADSPEILEESGYAFGNFQRLLSDFDSTLLHETIADFHNTPKRFVNFETAAEKDVLSRLDGCRAEAEFIISRKDTLRKITEGIKNGSIPLRVTHNDTKLNNILMDAETNKARAIIDLDTVMPGSMLYDFGDSIRFGTSTAAEDEKDLDKVHFDIDLYKAYESGFTRAMGDSMTDEERKLLPYSAYLMTMECGMRFLTDYLQGDTYFKIKYPEHNLVRCRTQLKLAKEMQERFKIFSDVKK